MGSRGRIPVCPRIFQDDSGILLAIDPSTDCQPAPVSRLPQELPFGIEDADRGSNGRRRRLGAQAPFAVTIVPRVVPAVDRPPAHAGDGTPRRVAGDGLEADPAGRDQVRDRLCHARASGAAAHCGLEPGRDPRVAESPPVRAGGDRAGRLGDRANSWASRPDGRGRGSPSASRSRSVARSTSTPCDCRCTGSISSSRAGPPACCARMPAGSAS